MKELDWWPRIDSDQFRGRLEITEIRGFMNKHCTLQIANHGKLFSKSLNIRARSSWHIDIDRKCGLKVITKSDYSPAAAIFML